MTEQDCSPSEHAVTVVPKAIRVTRYVCPGCRRSSSSRASIVDHLTRCWANPDNHACYSCANFDRGRCCGTASRECGCNGQDSWECSAGVDLTTGQAQVGCFCWVAR